MASTPRPDRRRQLPRPCGLRAPQGRHRGAPVGQLRARDGPAGTRTGGCVRPWRRGRRSSPQRALGPAAAAPRIVARPWVMNSAKSLTQGLLQGRQPARAEDRQGPQPPRGPDPLSARSRRCAPDPHPRRCAGGACRSAHCPRARRPPGRSVMTAQRLPRPRTPGQAVAAGLTLWAAGVCFGAGTATGSYIARRALST